MTDSVTALVPMKGYSERVPDKNRRSFNGRPLFHWILNTLEASPAVDEVVVDTDADDIAAGAREHFDVTVVERPPELQGDFVSMNDIILHDVSQVPGEYFLQTHCTNPLLRPDTVTDAVGAFFDARDRDSLFSVTPLQTRLWNEDCVPINHSRDELKRTQDLPPVYEENSNLYVFSQTAVERRENRIGDEPTMFEMDAEEAVDIDYPIDFRKAEFLHQDRYGESPALAEVV